LQQRLGITTIVVTHDQREAMTMADQIVVMSNGRVEQTGPPQEIYHQPSNAFVADFIGRANFFDGVMRGGKVEAAGLQLEAARTGFTDGSPITVAIRPEKASLVETPPSVNHVPAKITFVRDVGSTRDIHLETALGPIIVEYAIGETSRAYGVGETVDLELPPSALYVYPGVCGGQFGDAACCAALDQDCALGVHCDFLCGAVHSGYGDFFWSKD